MNRFSDLCLPQSVPFYSSRSNDPFPFNHIHPSLSSSLESSAQGNKIIHFLFPSISILKETQISLTWEEERSTWRLNSVRRTLFLGMKVLLLVGVCCWVSLVRGSVDDGVVGGTSDGSRNVTESPLRVNNEIGWRNGVLTEDGVPDDYLNWFFYHSFKKLDAFFQSENDKERQMDSSDELLATSNNWKIRVSKVILKLVLIVLAILGSVLFIFGVFLFMLFAFLLCKFLSHILQCLQERKKPKNNSSSTSYQVNV